MTMTQAQPEIVVRVSAADAAAVMPRGIPDDHAPRLRALWPGGLRITGKSTFWWIIALAVCMAWDRAMWLALSVNGKPRLEFMEGWLKWGPFVQRVRGALALDTAQIAELIGTVLYAPVYAFGRLHVWILLAIVLLVRDWTKPDTDKVRDGLRRAVFIFACPAAAGAGAEILKVLTRRMRPEHADGFYRFKGLREGATSVFSPAFWEGTGLGMASSHASVAFGGALAAGMLWPRSRWWLIGLALLTTISRVAVGAHFVSDVFVGATIGVLACAGFYAWDRHNHRGQGLERGVAERA